MTGQTISHYLIEEKLGQGGMGVVYRARDLRLNRTVAIKFLPEHLAQSPQHLARLRQEARAVSSLNHPNIATLYEIDESTRATILSFEYLGGGTLREKIRGQGRLSPIDAVRFALAIAGALAHAHEHKVLHRDVKSDNVLFATDGTPKLTDFGLAKMTGEDGVTRSGATVGTMAYMSPEQALGEELDEGTDIFSLGVVLFEMLTGTLPFMASTEAAVLHSIVYDPLPRVSGLSPSLEKTMLRMLEKSRAKRQTDMRQVISQLSTAQSELSTAELPTVTISVRPIRRRRGLTAKRAAAAAAIVAALAGAASVTPTVYQKARERWTGIPAKKQLVVLPFRSIDGTPEDQALSDGLTETLTSKLTRLEPFHASLFVVPASEVRSEALTTAQQAAAKFGANLVVTGTLQRVAQRLRVTLTLIDARERRQLESVSLDKRVEDTAELQDDVVDQVAGMLNLASRADVRQRIAAGGTRNSEAYRLYLEGAGYLARADCPENVEKAVSAFRSAAGADPGYALAHVSVANALVRKFVRTKDPALLAEARAAAQRAREIDESVPETHAVLGYIHTHTSNIAAAEAEFKRALELDPVNDAAYRGLAVMLRAAGKIGEAEATYQRAIQLRPNYWGTYGSLGSMYFQEGRYEEAEKMFRKVMELTPDNLFGLNNLGAIYLARSDYDRAIEVLTRALKLRPTQSVYSNLGTAHYYAGRYTEAAQMFERAADLVPKNHIFWGNLGDALRWTPSGSARSAEAYAKAIELARANLQVSPKDWSTKMSLATYLAKTGQRAEALTTLLDAFTAGARGGRIDHRVALIYELAGERAKAVEALGRALQEGYSRREIEHEPFFAALRKDSAYQTIVRERSSG